MTTYTIKLRTKEYRIGVNDVAHKDGSVSRIVSCNGKITFHPGLSNLPKAIVSVLSRELDNVGDRTADQHEQRSPESSN